MTRTTQDLSPERKLVVVFDVCSSTTILEDLKQTDNLTAWRNLLIALKDFLIGEPAKLGLEAHKFIGDGWILLFPADISQTDLTDFLRDLSMEFDSGLDCSIKGLLQRPVSPIGLTFGVDAGELVRLEMNEKTEYLGRAINVAFRLQEAAKGLPGNPGYRVLLSNHSFNSLPSSKRGIKVRTVTVQLRNISDGGRYECLEYRVF